MEDDLNSFERRLLTKPCVFVDASVILASALREEGGEPCHRYLTKANFGYRPFITKSIMGEILRRLVDIDETRAQSGFIFIKNLLKDKNFHFPKHYTHQDSLDFLKENCSYIPEDDLCHISHIYAVISRQIFKETYKTSVHFATIDPKINHVNMARKINAEFGIKIINPQTIP